MKKIIFILFLIANSMFAQVGIGTTNPDASSILELQSNSKGFLPPRLTTAQRDAITTPAQGLFIYNTTTNCFQYFDGVSWSGCLIDSSTPVFVCSPSPVIAGTYAVGATLIISNTVTVSVTSTKAEAYTIISNTVNGYSFSASGVFPSAGTHSIVLEGKGIPVLAQTDAFSIYILGEDVATCSFNITVTPTYISCKEYKDNGFNTDGIYIIDSDGVGGNAPYNSYCNMTNDGGGWTLVFRHDIAGGLFTNDAQADLINIGSPGLTTTKYSILSKIDELKSAAPYEFRLIYPNEGIRNHWTQTFNPRSGPSPIRPVAGYTAINIAAAINFWGGLEKSGATTFLDGSVNHTNWWYSIGSQAVFPGGIPGSSTAVSIVELYIR